MISSVATKLGVLFLEPHDDFVAPRSTERREVVKEISGEDEERDKPSSGYCWGLTGCNEREKN